MQETVQQALLNSGLVNEDALKIALSIQEQTKEDLVSIVLERENIPDEKVLPVLEEIYGIPSIDLDSYVIEPDVLEMVPEMAARDFLVIPLYLVGDTLTVASCDPLNLEASEYLRALTNKEIQFLLSTKRTILKGINRYYVSKEAIHRALKEIADKEKAKDSLPESYRTTKELDLKVEDAPVVRLVNFIMAEGINMGATDIHLEPLENRISLRYRVDGVMYNAAPPPYNFYNAVVSRIKILSRLDVAEKRLPQDGRLSMKFEDRTVDMRISILPFIHGEGICIRILDRGAVGLSLDELGFEPDDLKRYKRAITAPNGMLLVTGPTGSGKTTTLYSTIKELFSSTRKFITVEDPVENRMDGVMQLQVNPDINFNFAEALRFILRHDPDTIMVGEIRDQESAEIAVRAALTGHFLLSTLHTLDAASAIDRLVDIGIETYMLQSTLRAVMSQRLIRKLCPHCKVSVKPNANQIELLNLDPETQKKEFFEPKGCDQCRRLGYWGRIAIFELVTINDILRELPTSDFNSNNVRRMEKEVGIRTMRQNAILKALEGITSLDEVLTITSG